MIPSYSSKDFIQYKGYLRTLLVNLDNVRRIKITDSKTNCELFNSDINLVDKREWSSDGYSQEYRYLFEKNHSIDDNQYLYFTRIYFVTDKETNKIKIMSLEHEYYIPYNLKIEYKTDQTNFCNNIYELNFE